MVRPQSGYLLLEDGARFNGEALYGPPASLGEAVFNTSHSGYQEILTDPSYFRQIMVFTMPHIGNVGVNELDVESVGVMAAGAVVRSLAPAPSNWRSSEPLEEWMAAHNRPLLTGVDTRAVTLHLRERGAQRAGVFSSDIPEAEALRQVQESPSMSGLDLASEVSSEKRWSYEAGDLDERWFPRSTVGDGLKIAVLDFGVKRNILRELSRRGAAVEVFPGATPASELSGFDGILLSNGPGDPAAVEYGIDTTRELLGGNTPIYGICLGHQILSLAAGLETYKLRFGHRGANHPVRREQDAAVEITSQNHGFAVKAPGWPDPSGSGITTDPGDPKPMKPGFENPGHPDIDTFLTENGRWRISHINLNDKTVEGLEQADKPVFSIQYHPEASPGPHEGWTYFDRFLEMCQEAK